MKRLCILIVFLTGLIMITDAQTDSTTLIKTGDKAPVFSCKTLDGKAVDLAKLQGKVILINFFATWCPPCNQELPVLQENIWNRYKSNKDFVLLVVGREHNEKEIADFAASRKFSMPFVADQDRGIYKLFATQYIPRNILIGKDGRIIFQNRGYTKKEFDEIESLIAEKLK
jgi:peroxiredoxin